MLVVATFGAFFVAQRLKNSPSVVQRFRLDPVFSPNGDGRKDRAHVTFRLKRADDVTVSVVNSAGDVVRQLASHRIAAYTPVRFGGTAATTPAPGCPTASTASGSRCAPRAAASRS